MTAKPFSQTRTLNRGLLAEAKEKETVLRIQIDAIWKSILDVGAPLDQALTYIDQLDVKRLDVHVADLKRKKGELADVLREIEHLNADLGIED